jgi:hypothetical protein
MAVDVVIDGAAVREAIAELKKVEPALEKALRRDLKSSLSGLASGIGGSFPSQGELSGMNDHLGRTRYQKPRASASFTPGVARRGRVSSLFGVRVKGSKTAVGAWLSEMAGMRGIANVGGMSRSYTKNGVPAQHRLSGQGAYMIDRLNRRTAMIGRGGRYGWAYFSKRKGAFRDKGLKILNKAVDALNRSK